MSSHQLLLLTAVGALQLLNTVSAGNGYHYERPIPNSPKTGHIFQPLATVLPLPPLPSLPPLPTPRPTSLNSIIASYLPPNNRPQNQFSSNPGLLLAPRQSPQLQQQQQQPRILPTYVAPTAPTAGSFATSRFFGPSAPTAGGFAPQLPSALYGSSAPSGPAVPSLIPFGQTQVINPPRGDNDDIYLGPKGRQLKQYAVIEVIDNDIAQAMQPFLPAGYFDNIRAQLGTPGTGANSADPGAVQFESRIGDLVQQQQRFAPQQQQQQQRQQQNGRSSNSDAISLGSGGLGYVRLPNGNIYLGSGSLGYISDQQHQKFVQEARTRTGARQPDALHFGHGALGGTGNGFSFRFK